MKIIVASHNPGKVQEIKNIINASEIYSLEDLNYMTEIEEFGVTFEQNALIKCQLIAQKYPDFVVIADDSGLEVEALDNQPGVFSARYASDNKEHGINPDKANIEKLLLAMKDINNRSACFRTVLCVIKPNCSPVFVQAKVKGTISYAPIGEYGFGYDPIFSHDGLKTFGQLSSDEKNKVSHRALALKNLQESGIL